MKIVAICGSPRKGNTEQMLNWVLDACRAGGGDVELIRLGEIDIKPCEGCCRTCYGTGFPCVIEDGMEVLLSKMLEADAILLGSPNYFTNISGQLKVFMDRTNPLCKPPLLKDKPAGFVCVGARPAEETGFLVKIFDEYCREMKIVSLGSVVARATDPGELEKKEDVKLACADLGNRILGSLGH
ncbi:flavodoxin family protein [Candidatus Woesearchaeota archaeon]|nr:flavodoxin family protein [Candidatus Woesearchaeota archaeon]